MPKFKFGTSDYDDKLIIAAETLDEAKREFAFQVGDVSRYTHKGDQIFYKIMEEPYGFTNGIPNEDFKKPNFYQRIPIKQELPSTTHNGYFFWEEVGEITAQEIEIIVATPEHLLLTNKSDNTEPNDAPPSRGIMMLRNQSRSIQLQFRNKQLDLLMLKSKSSFQMQEYKRENEKIEHEQRQIQEKIEILQTYSGIGKDLVKVHSGNPSKAKNITIFQAFRYMKEDIELLTDFEDFDHESLEKFDDFLAKNYKELIPVNLSIQAFKVSKYPILYKTETMYGTAYAEDKENLKTFIIIRNGDNVYRMFNKYKLNGKLFHSEDEMENAIKQVGSFRPSVIDDLEHKPNNFWEITGQQAEKEGWNRIFKIPISIPFYPDLDSQILEREFDRCIQKFEDEITRREQYIETHNLHDKLTPYSWRWGRYVGDLKLKFLENYYETFYRMYAKEAFRTKDYASMGTLDMTSSSYRKEFSVTAEDNTYIYPDNMYLYDYPSSYDKDSQRFNPLSGASFTANVIRGDNHFLATGFYEEARENFMQKVWAETDKMHMANFHSVAILQNILDNRKMFPDHDVDFITGDGIEQVNRIYDAENMLYSQESKDRVHPKDLLNKVLQETYQYAKSGQLLFLLKNYEMKTEYSGSRYERNYTYKRHFEPAKGDHPYTHQQAKITYYNRSSVTAEGMIARYQATNYSKHIWAGDPKMGKITTKKENNVYGNEKIIVSKEAISANERELKDMMKRREFREEHYPTYGVIFKYLLKLLREQPEDV